MAQPGRISPTQLTRRLLRRPEDIEGELDSRRGSVRPRDWEWRHPGGVPLPGTPGSPAPPAVHKVRSI